MGSDGRRKASRGLVPAERAKRGVAVHTMIVYRALQQEVQTASYLQEIRSVLRRLECDAFRRHEYAVELLIDYGEFEAAVADLLSTDANRVHPTVTLVRRTSLPLGHLFCCSWERDADRAGLWAARFAAALEKLAAPLLPSVLPLRVPEGYAYYSLYPEAYLQAAARFFADVMPHAVTCLGIRSIGTSLSTVVAAALAERGCRVESYTVRCQGHPFDRHLQLDPALEALFRTTTDHHFLVIDEGPGLSGSSLGRVAQKLAELGAPTTGLSSFPVTTSMAPPSCRKSAAPAGRDIASTWSGSRTSGSRADA